MEAAIRLVVIHPWGDFRVGDVVPDDQVEAVLAARSHQVVRASMPPTEIRALPPAERPATNKDAS